MTPPHTFRAAIHQQFDRFYPGHDGGKVLVRWKGGSIRTEIPCALATVPFDRALSACQEAIVEALKKCDGEPPITGEALAKLAGYESSGGAYKRALAALIAAGQVINCRPGYQLRNEAAG